MTVVAGIEETDATALVRLAAQEARYRDAPLIVIIGFSSDNGMGAPAARPVATLRTPDDSEAVAAALLEREVTAALGEDAGTVTRRTVRGATGRGLVDVARQEAADLIVIAARRGPVLTGPAGQQYVLRHAPCPVLVMPAIGAG